MTHTYLDEDLMGKLKSALRGISVLKGWQLKLNICGLQCMLCELRLGYEEPPIQRGKISPPAFLCHAAGPSIYMHGLVMVQGYNKCGHVYT